MFAEISFSFSGAFIHHRAVITVFIGDNYPFPHSYFRVIFLTAADIFVYLSADINGAVVIVYHSFKQGVPVPEASLSDSFFKGKISGAFSRKLSTAHGLMDAPAVTG